jgi:hypothetical protein
MQEQWTALTYICFVSSTDVSLKYAVGPYGRYTRVIASEGVQKIARGGNTGEDVLGFL